MVVQLEQTFYVFINTPVFRIKLRIEKVIQGGAVLRGFPGGYHVLADILRGVTVMNFVFIMISTKFPVGNQRMIIKFFVNLLYINYRIPIRQILFYNPHHAGVFLSIAANRACTLIPEACMDIPVAEQKETACIDALIPVFFFGPLYKLRRSL